MCLITTQSKPIILKEDIIVYKEVGIQKYAKEYAAVAFYYSFVYFKNITNPIIMLNGYPYNKNDKHYDIQSYTLIEKALYEGINLFTYKLGYHSFINPRRSNNEDTLNDNLNCYDKNLVEFTIPAGAQVVYDNDGLCVSSQIILTDKRF